MTNLTHLPQGAWTLFGSVAAVLSVATLLGFALKWRFAPQQPHAVIDNLNARLRAWWVMIGVLVIAFAAGREAVLLLFLGLSCVALREFVQVMRCGRSDRYAVAAACFFVLPVQYGLLWVNWYGLFAIFIPVYAFALLPILAALPQDADRFLARTASLQWGLMVCVYAVSHVPALLNLSIPGYEGRNVLLMAYLIIVVQGSDVLQYIWGKLFGRRKLAPVLSPSKTVEGLVGGVVSASLLGLLLHPLTPFTALQSGLIALLVTLMGFGSGLVLSAVKRDHGVKDWGAVIEGHGGMLDRLDSMVFSAPLFFHIVRFWWS